MDNLLFPWQKEAWQQLQQLRERLPHAILFHGGEGIGKSGFAEHFAQSILCEAPAEQGHACGQCVSCGWFVQYGHPDYRRVRPEILDDEPGEAEEGADAGDGKKTAKSIKAPSKEIKIDQIRALGDFMNVSTHRQGMRVILLYPAEALNSAASNALLKTLEEPPSNTLFLLVTNSLDRLLPTILSRCRKFAMPMPSQEQALAWLQEQGIKDAASWLAGQGGAPLLAYEQAQAGSSEDMDALLAHLSLPNVEGALKTADRLQKTPVSQSVGCLQRWMYDIFSCKLASKVRYYPRYQKELTALAGRIDVAQLMKELKTLNDRKAIADHPLSAKLFLEEMLLSYNGLFSQS